VIGLRQFLSDDAGATIVEFALVAPTVLLLLIACLDFARVGKAYVIVANASREGARYASAQPRQVPDADIANVVLRYVAPLDTTALTVHATYGPRDSQWSNGTPAPRAVTVRVTYSIESATWLIGSFFTAAAGTPWFDVSSTMEGAQ